MRMLIRWTLVASCLAMVFAAGAQGAENFRRLPVETYVSKMKAGWIGQMAAVGWGGPTEFKFRGEIIPEDKMPEWKPGLINQFHQDDIYVEMTFLQTLDAYGLDCSIRQAGIDFANSGYPLWHANRAGRDNPLTPVRVVVTADGISCSPDTPVGEPDGDWDVDGVLRGTFSWPAPQNLTQAL